MEAIALKSRRASRSLLQLSNEKKNSVLESVACLLSSEQEAVFEANRSDLSAGGSLSAPLLRRLDLSSAESQYKYDALIEGVRKLKELEDPVNRLQLARQLDEGLNLFRVATPVGVVTVIFESRPEVCIQISALALKSGNAVLLKGGKEAAHSNECLVRLFRRALAQHSVIEDAVQLVETREQVNSLLELDSLIDLVIPRGSKSLVRHVQANTKIPVLGHADGLCSIYIDEESTTADQRSHREMVCRVVLDSKLNSPSACNAVETLLLHRSALNSGLWTALSKELVENGVTLKVDTSLAEGNSKFLPVTGEDFDTEFLDSVLAVRVVHSLDEAIEHINTHGSGHTDCILTQQKENAERFMCLVDSAGVYWNASTRFADGFRYGFGAEIGVSTNRTHARGPVGLEGLMIYKYRLYGHGQICEDYQKKKKEFTHLDIDLVLP